jgi:hypothetical protein
LVTSGIALTVFLLANATGGFQVNAGDSDTLIPSILKSPTLNWIFSLSLLSLILIPIGTICYAIILFILDSTVRVNVKSVFLSWLICLALFIGISIYSAGNVNIERFKIFGETMKEKTNYDIDIQIKEVPPIAPLMSEDGPPKILEKTVIPDTAILNSEPL